MTYPEKLDLAEYVQWRKENNGDRQLDINPAKYGDEIEALLNECKKVGLDMNLVSSAIDDDDGPDTHRACDRLVLRLLEDIVTRTNFEKKGKTDAIGRGEVFPPSLISELAVHMLESCIDSETVPPSSLAILLRAQLDRTEPAQFVPRESYAKKLAAFLWAASPGLSARQIAGAVGVNVTTVTRWHRDDAEFREKSTAGGTVRNVRHLLGKLRQRGK